MKYLMWKTAKWIIANRSNLEYSVMYPHFPYCIVFLTSITRTILWYNTLCRDVHRINPYIVSLNIISKPNIIREIESIQPNIPYFNQSLQPNISSSQSNYY